MEENERIVREFLKVYQTNIARYAFFEGDAQIQVGLWLITADDRVEKLRESEYSHLVKEYLGDQSG